jgi:hypothetical protein
MTVRFVHKDYWNSREAEATGLSVPQVNDKSRIACEIPSCDMARQNKYVLGVSKALRLSTERVTIIQPSKERQKWKIRSEKKRNKGYSGDPNVSVINGSDAGKTEARQSGPFSELSRVTSNPNEYPVGRRRAVQDEQLVPAWRRDLGVRWGCDSAHIVSRARERRENRATAHGVSVSARRRRDQRDRHAGCLALGQLHVDLVIPTVRPVCDWDRHGGLREARVQVRRYVYLDAQLLWECGLCVIRVRVRARDEHARIGEEGRFGVVQPRDRRGVQN